MSEKALQIHVGMSIADAERVLILATYQKHNRNKTRTAAVLGISLKTLYNKLHVYGVIPDRPPEQAVSI